MPSTPSHTGYERLDDYPNNGALATRRILIIFLIYFAVGIIFAIVSVFTEQVKWWVALVPVAISFALLIWAFGRIIQYYLLLRRQEASGILFDPKENLSINNYLRVLVFLDPKGYTTSLRGIDVNRIENLDFYYDIPSVEDVDLDEHVASDSDIEDAHLDGPVEDDERASIENAAFDPPTPEDDDMAVIENPVLDPPVNADDDSVAVENIVLGPPAPDDDMAGLEDDVMDAPFLFDLDAGLPNADEVFADANLEAPVGNEDDIPVPHGNVDDAVLDAPVEEN